MAFITRCWKRARLEWLAVLGCAALSVTLALPLHAQTQGAEITQLKVARDNNSIQLDASVKFELPTAVENALLKGVAIFFETKVEVYRERWYWMDKRVVSASRHMRLVYQPLTRRWRLALSTDDTQGDGAGLALNQTFDTLEEALVVIRRVSGWQIGSMSDIEPGAKHRLEFMFQLDVTQLPRPLQIGTFGQNDWVLGAEMKRQIRPEELK